MDERKQNDKVVVYLDRTLSDWIESKALEGYKKATLIRRAMHVYRDSEIAGEELKKHFKLEGGEHGEGKTK